MCVKHRQQAVRRALGVSPARERSAWSAYKALVFQGISPDRERQKRAWLHQAYQTDQYPMVMGPALPAGSYRLDARRRAIAPRSAITIKPIPREVGPLRGNEAPLASSYGKAMRNAYAKSLL